jgi:non-specific serine/threonine protein kinase
MGNPIQTLSPPEGAEFVDTVEEYVWRFGEAEFNEARWELRVRGKLVDLEPKPLEILGQLLRFAGEVVTKEELLSSVWPGVIVVDKALTNAIGKLRKAVDDLDQSLIETVHRVGYRFTAPVKRKAVTPVSGPRLSLKPGELVPRRPQWRLLKALDLSATSEIWLAEHEKNHARRVFKFAVDGARLSSLKREATLSRVLTEALGQRPDVVHVLEWNFEQPPYFLECEYGGEDWMSWSQRLGGIAQLSLQQRLDLFLQALDAVAAAHSVGVLHKDLKPANLLIEARADGGWQVRITDFGSGRLLDPGRLAALGVTRLGFTQTQGVHGDSFTGTPLYLAPEVMAGHLPTQGADVYALGVLLYQLAVGDLKKPISPGWESSVADDLLRADIAAAAHGDPAQRIQTVHELGERLRALESRRNRKTREDALAAKAAQLQRALELSRATRPWMLAAGLSLAIGVAIGAGYLVKALHAQTMAETQRQRAEAVNDFLNDDLLSAADPLLTGKGGITVLEAVNRSAAEVDHRFAATPDMAAAVHLELAHAFSRVGDEKSAAVEFGKAAQLFLYLRGADSTDALAARIQRVQSLTGDGQVQQAESEVQAIGSLIAADGIRSPEIEMLLHGANGRLAFQRGDYPAARKDEEAALTLAERYIVADPEMVRRNREFLSRLRKDYAFSLEDTGDAAKAEQLMRETLELDQKRFGPDHAQVLVDQFQLARALSVETPPKPEAERALQELLPKMNLALGAENPYQELIYNDLGSLYMGRKDWTQAIAQYQESYRLSRRLHGDAHQHTIAEAFNLGLCYSAAGQVPAAIEVLQLADANAPKTLGATAPVTQVIKYLLADAYLRLGDAAHAAPLMAQLDPAALKKVEPDYDWPQRMPLLQAELALAQAPTAAAQQQLAAAIQALQDVPASKDDRRDDLLEQARRQLARAQGGKR